MDAAQERVAEIVAARKVAPKRKGAKKPQVAPDSHVSVEGKRAANGRFVKGVKPPVGTPFAPGNPGGPGRPSLADAILRVLAEDDERAPGHSKVEAVARATVGLAMKGSIGHVALIIERTDGKVTQPVEVGNKPGEAFAVVDLATMTPEELAAYEQNLAILAAAHARSGDGADAGPVPPSAD